MSLKDFFKPTSVKIIIFGLLLFNIMRTVLSIGPQYAVPGLTLPFIFDEHCGDMQPSYADFYSSLNDPELNKLDTKERMEAISSTFKDPGGMFLERNKIGYNCVKCMPKYDPNCLLCNARCNVKSISIVYNFAWIYFLACIVFFIYGRTKKKDPGEGGLSNTEQYSEYPKN